MRVARVALHVSQCVTLHCLRAHNCVNVFFVYLSVLLSRLAKATRGFDFIITHFLKSGTGTASVNNV